MSSARKILLMSSRGVGLLALLSGAAFIAGAGIPLHAHMGLGGLLVLAVWGLAAIGVRRQPLLAVVAALVALLVPVLGMLQLMGPLFGSLLLTQVLHVSLALAAMGAAEVLGKRLA